jgi:PAS domain S-box-containing protein
LNPATNALRCVDVWVQPETDLEEFAAQTREMESALGEGLPGRVWAQAEPAWITDLGDVVHFRRREAAVAARLRGAFAFPVRIDGVVRQVVEFFCRDLREPDPELMRVFSAIGIQMGQFLERSRAAEQLRASEERFRLLFELSPVPVALHRGDGKYLKVNQAYQQMVGYSRDELLQLGVRRITHPDDVSDGQQRLSELMAGTCHTYQREKRFLHKNNGVIWARTVASAVRNEARELDYIISVVEDITKRKREERVAAEFSNLAHRLSAALSAKDAARTIADAASNLFAWDACYLHLLSPAGLIHPVLTMDTVEGSRLEVERGAFTLDPSPLMTEVIARGAKLINRDPAGPVPAPALTRFGDVNRPSASMMYVPIRKGTQSVGVMSVQSYIPHAYSKEDLNLFQSLADQCAVAIERIHAVEEMGRSEARQRALLNAVPDLMLRLQRDGTIIDCKVSNADDLATHVQRSVGCKLRDSWPEAIADALLLEVGKVLNEGAPRIIEFEFSGPAGTRDYEARLVCSGPEEVLAMVRDYTERKQLENEVLIISAREQQRIGKDLHDGLGQLLTGLAFFARALQEKLADKSLAESADAAQLTQLALKATTQARLMARGLYPVELETRGLAAALTELAHSMEKLHNLSCSVELDTSLPPFGKSQDRHLFRIVQEASNNAVKHSQCRQITITLRAEGHGALLAIRDDGRGIKPGVPRADGMGLRIMRYRARRIGARLDVRPATGGGTEVLLRIPRRKRKLPDPANL